MSKLIVFDVFGTLLDFPDGNSLVYKRIIRDFIGFAGGVGLAKDTVDMVTSKRACLSSNMPILHRIAEAITLNWNLIIGSGMAAALADYRKSLLTAEQDLVDEMKTLRVFADVKPVLQHFHNQEDVYISLCTNAAVEYVDTIARFASGLRGTMMISSVSGSVKPSRTAYEVPMQMQKLTHTPVFVGDDLKDDYEVPTEVGYDAFLLDRRGLYKGVRSIGNLRELIELDKQGKLFKEKINE